MNVKQVIVIRKDLKMRRGKEIAQGAHASMAWLTNRLRARPADEEGQRRATLDEAESAWVDGSFAKVCVQVDSEQELREIFEAARAAQIASELIVDSGRTEFGGVPTPTCCAVGPALSERIDLITGHLRLY